MFTTAKHVCLSSFDSQLESKLATLWRLLLVTKSMFAKGLCALIDVEMWLNFVMFCHDLALKGGPCENGKLG
jgi:hypothetical protein